MVQCVEDLHFISVRPLGRDPQHGLARLQDWLDLGRRQRRKEEQVEDGPDRNLRHREDLREEPFDVPLPVIPVVGKDGPGSGAGYKLKHVDIVVEDGEGSVQLVAEPLEVLEGTGTHGPLALGQTKT